MNQRNYDNALCADEKSSVLGLSSTPTVTSATGFLSRLSYPNLITSRLKDKCSEQRANAESHDSILSVQSDDTGKGGKCKTVVEGNCVKQIRLSES